LQISNYNFLIKIISSTLKAIVYCSLSWQRLQLVLCHINNFYGKVSSVDGQLLMPNIIDTVRFL